MRFSLGRLPRHPFLGALKWKPSGIPSAAIVRSQYFSQFQLSFFRRRAGDPAAPAQVAQCCMLPCRVWNRDRSLTDRSRFSDRWRYVLALDKTSV